MVSVHVRTSQKQKRATTLKQKHTSKPYGICWVTEFTRLVSFWPTRPRPNTWSFFSQVVSLCLSVRRKTNSFYNAKITYATTMHVAWWVTEFARFVLHSFLLSHFCNCTSKFAIKTKRISRELHTLFYAQLAQFYVHFSPCFHEKKKNFSSSKFLSTKILTRDWLRVFIHFSYLNIYSLDHVFLALSSI